MNFEFWDLVRWLLWIICAFQGLSLINALIKQLALKREISTQPILTEHSKVGDFVKIEGEIRFPVTQTPFFKQPCSYWEVRAQGEFETKRKKPGRGFETHQPVIYRQSNADLPVLMEAGKYQIQWVVQALGDIIMNPERKTQIKDFPTYPEIQAVAKPKFKKYIFSETWLPIHAKVACLGHILEFENNRVILGHFPQSSKPALLYLGNFEALQKQMQGKVNLGILFLVGVLGFGGLSFWLNDTQAFANLGLNLLSFAFLILLWFFRAKARV